MTTTTTETGVTTQVYRVYIKATPQAIWDAITDARVDGALRLPGARRVRPAPGRRVSAASPSEEMRAHGHAEVIVDGEVIEADPPRRLVQTWRALWDPTQIAAEGFTRSHLGDRGERRAASRKLTVTHDVDGRAEDGGATSPARIAERRRRLELDPQRPQDAARDRHGAPRLSRRRCGGGPAMGLGPRRRLRPSRRSRPLRRCRCSRRP